MGALDIPTKKIELFLHHSTRHILGISMDEVKYQHITNETVRKKLFDIPNIKKQIATQQLTFIGKMARNYDDHLPTKLLTAWCNHKIQRGGALYTNNTSHFSHHLHLVRTEKIK